MLVLSRKKDESVVISTENGMAEVYVVEIRGDKVRLGFEAPKEFLVHRKEVYEAIQRENNSLGTDETPGQHKRYIESNDMLLYDPLNSIEFKSYRSFRKELSQQM